jgi:hypothetical protein
LSKFHWEANVKNNDAIYGLGILGAAVYFVQHASGFWQGILGILKAVIWPAVVLYGVLDLLKL